MVSLSKKYAYGAVVLSAAFLTVAVLSFCRLKMFPRDGDFFEQFTTFPATTEWQAETTGTREINEVEPTMSAGDDVIMEETETTRVESSQDESEPFYDPDQAQQIYRAAIRSETTRLQAVFSIASILTVAMLAVLLVFTKESGVWRAWKCRFFLFQFLLHRSEVWCSIMKNCSGCS